MKTEIMEQVARLGLERTLLNLRLALTPLMESEDGDGEAGAVDEEEEVGMVSDCQVRPQYDEAVEGGAEEEAAAVILNV